MNHKILKCFDLVAIMSSGELGYDEFLFNEETKAYYVSGFALLIIFTIVMVVLVTNLLIGKDFTCRFY